jgi:hypothetical protein
VGVNRRKNEIMKEKIEHIKDLLRGVLTDEEENIAKLSRTRYLDDQIPNVVRAWKHATPERELARKAYMRGEFDSPDFEKAEIAFAKIDKIVDELRRDIKTEPQSH